MRFSSSFVMIGFIMLGLTSRFLPHPPNFTAINAMALLSPLYLRSRCLSLVTLLLTALLSDLVFGFHSEMLFVYLSYCLMILISERFMKKMECSSFLFLCMMMSCLFFLLTNYGVWSANSLYPRTLAGLVQCYLAALPFFLNQVSGDLLYGILLSALFNYNQMNRSIDAYQTDFPIHISLILNGRSRIRS